MISRRSCRSIVIILGVFLLASAVNTAAAAVTQAEAAVNATDGMDAPLDPTGQSSREAYAEAVNKKCYMVDPKRDGTFTPRFEVGEEHYYYAYKERNDVGAFMGVSTNNYNGIYAKYTCFLRENPLDPVSFLRLEGRYATGELSYASASGIFNSIKDRTWEIRGLVGREYNVSGWNFAPYMGVAMRDLFNQLSSVGNGGYDRESKYWYAPLGVDVSRDLPGKWRLTANMEYDWLWRGQQTSHNEQIQGWVDSDGIPHDLDTMINDQPHGYGLRGSFKVQKDMGRIGIFIEPFARYWSIARSTVVPWTSHGVVITDSVGTWQGWEPKNTTKEVGVKMGANF